MELIILGCLIVPHMGHQMQDCLNYSVWVTFIFKSTFFWAWSIHAECQAPLLLCVVFYYIWTPAGMQNVLWSKISIFPMFLSTFLGSYKIVRFQQISLPILEACLEWLLSLIFKDGGRNLMKIFWVTPFMYTSYVNSQKI